jgi:predicted transcriptional regulator
MTAALEVLPTGQLQERVNCLEWALRLNLEAGLRAFPLASKGDGYKPGVTGYRGKIPYTAAELERMPWNRAIGVGVAERPGIIGLDVDVKGGTRLGLLHLSQLTEIYGASPESPRFATKTGGFHVRYRLPQGTEGRSLSDTLRLPDGTETHIDVIQSRHRFYRIYDLQAWLDAAVNAPPDLPDTWLPAILKQHHPKPVLRLISNADQPEAIPRSPSTSELIQRITEASEGTRNTTLNTVAFAALTRGDTDEATREVLIQAAIASGLGLAEATATLESAWTAAWTKWQPINNWLDAVEQRVASTGLRSPWELATAEHLADLTMRIPKPWIDMSARRLAEQIGTSHTIAARALNHLVDWGLLTHRNGKGIGLAKAYRISTNRRIVDICPPTQEGGGYMSRNRPFGVRYRKHRLLHDLLAHPAFRQVDGGPVLTRTCAEVLVALRSGGPMTRTLLQKETTRSADAIRRAVKRLQSIGVVEDRRREGIHLTKRDHLHNVLDKWLVDMGEGHRGSLIRYRHQQQRLAYYRQHGLIEPASTTTEATRRNGPV